MINNFAFNPNPRVHKPNLVKNGNSTGNTKTCKDTRKANDMLFYKKITAYQEIGQIIDYSVSKNNKIKKLLKAKKKAN